MRTTKTPTIALVLIMAALLAPAVAKAADGRAKVPRLGSFTGQGGAGPAFVRFEYRKARGKLYWQAGNQGAKPLRQSFDVTSDRVKGGYRVIEYARPADGSRSARYNQRQLSKHFGRSVLGQKGKGMIVIRPKGDVVWSNSGSLTVPARNGSVGAISSVSWNEHFTGRRPSRASQPAK